MFISYNYVNEVRSIFIKRQHLYVINDTYLGL